MSLHIVSSVVYALWCLLLRSQGDGVVVVVVSEHLGDGVELSGGVWSVWRSGVSGRVSGLSHEAVVSPGKSDARTPAQASCSCGKIRQPHASTPAPTSRHRLREQSHLTRTLTARQPRRLLVAYQHYTFETPSKQHAHPRRRPAMAGLKTIIVLSFVRSAHSPPFIPRH